MKKDILERVRAYGTGRDTLRCLAVATVDSPPRPEQMDLVDSKKFVQYEVGKKLFISLLWKLRISLRITEASIRYNSEQALWRKEMKGGKRQ